MPRLSKIGAAALAAFGWSSGTSGVTASYLVVAGGGGGSGSGAGGGGAGGLLTGTTPLNPTQSYTVLVGAGGSGALASAATNGSSGSNSQFGNLTASVGGGGGGRRQNGLSGGSGGGGGALNTTYYSGGAGTSGQGNTGGNAGGSAYVTGGGGGAGAVGSNGVAGQSGAGGVGVASSISGSSVTYAGGGGGGGVAGGAGSAANGGAGGTGGGGAGGTSDGQSGTSGTANTGGGGGSGVASNTDGNGGNGGSGIVIISYAGAQQFGGGVVTSVGGNTIHTFTTSGTLSPITSLSASYLVVAGGGGGGYDIGAGAGAGGLLTGSGLVLDTNSIYTVTVGSGGARATSPTTGGNGTNSSFGLVATSAVGGGGGASNGGTYNGAAGGSGGGGAITGTGGAGTSGQGNSGGNAGGGIGGGGGGGAGAVGATGTALQAGAGGVGVASSITGTSTFYAGGGGAGGYGAISLVAGAGGNGGGGAGGGSGAAGTAGTANTGGGGGAGGQGVGGGGNGGSGVVIISYPGSTAQMSGGTVTIVGGNVIHTFTSSGYLSPIVLLNRSLRFRSSASAYLSRTPAGAGNRTTWTWSGWVKRGRLGVSQKLFTANNDISGNYQFGVNFTASDTLLIFSSTASIDIQLVSSAVYRDPSAWYHVVVTMDTTQATNTNRVKLYVNGVQVTAFGTATYPAQNNQPLMNAAVIHGIGAYVASAGQDYGDEYLAEINFIDGQALTPSSFGSFNAYGSWSPVRYGGSYGTNGFYLPFTNNASTTTLGYDFSPNGNNWTTNNISLTAGSTYDSMTDVPTLTSATAANYCVLNPLVPSNGGALTNGNLTWTLTGNFGTKEATIASPTLLQYAEFTIVSGVPGIGLKIPGSNPTVNPGTPPSGLWGYYDNTASWNIISNGSGTYSTGSIVSAGQIWQIAYNPISGNAWIGKDNVWYNSTGGTNGNPSAATNPTFSGLANNLVMCVNGGNVNGVLSANFGQQPFTYTPPSGFVALNTYNL